MHINTYNKLIKIASDLPDLSGGAIPRGFGNNSTIVTGPPRKPVNLNYLPGADIETPNTLPEVLKANYDNLNHWAKGPYASQFFVQKNKLGQLGRLMASPRIVNGRQLPGAIGKRTTDWMCLQGLGYCSPGDPTRLPGDTYTTTFDLNQAINNNTRIPINPNFNLYVLTDNAARDIDYNLPGAWHVAEYPDGSGHAVMGAGEGNFFDFNRPGLVVRPDESPGRMPWMYRARYNEYAKRGEDWMPMFKNARMMMALPNKIAPGDVPGQFYDLMMKQDRMKGRKDLLTRDEFIALYNRQNEGRPRGSHFIIPSFVRNSAPVKGYTILPRKQTQVVENYQAPVDGIPSLYNMGDVGGIY